MSDISLIAGSDLSLTESGDLEQADGINAGQRRVLRRLVTNPGGYIYAKNYGAGLPSRIGLTGDISELQATILAQILLEDEVSGDPAPEATVTELSRGTFRIHVTYTSASDGQTVAVDL